MRLPLIIFVFLGLGQAQSTKCVITDGDTAKMAPLSAPGNFTLVENLNGTSKYFSNCTYTPDAGDTTPHQRNIKVKTDCLPTIPPDMNVTGIPFINYFCSPIARRKDLFFDQVPRSNLLSIPPKCDPTYPNSPGSREFFMQMVNTWREIAGLDPLKFNECLAKRSNRPTGGHSGFGNKANCTVGKCGGVIESAFAAHEKWNWWRRISIPMCSFLGNDHRISFLHPNLTKIGYYYTRNIKKGGYFIHVQSC